jgi:hypothetical protein
MMNAWIKSHSLAILSSLGLAVFFGIYALLLYNEYSGNPPEAESKNQGANVEDKPSDITEAGSDIAEAGSDIAEEGSDIAEAGSDIAEEEPKDGEEDDDTETEATSSALLEALLPKSGAPKSLGDLVSLEDLVDLKEGESVFMGSLQTKKGKKGRLVYNFLGIEGESIRVQEDVRKKASRNGCNVTDYMDCLLLMIAKGEWRNEQESVLFELTELVGLKKLEPGEAEALLRRSHDSSPAAIAFEGKWGVRMSIPSAQWNDQLLAFDVDAFAEQIAQLTSASHVMVNVTHPANSCFYTGPHPALAKLMGDGSFPKRDLLGEVLDAIHATGKKALVYFACEGFYHSSATRRMNADWAALLKSKKMGPWDGTRQLILQHYAEKYGAKIDGWWFDGARHISEKERILWKEAVRATNPNTIVAFNRMAGPPYRSTRQCDIFGGHPTPRTRAKAWDPVNLPMIEAIEKSAWMDVLGNPVDDKGYGALGNVFMPMQANWNAGECAFPLDQAVDWTTRVLKAGGTLTWVAPRDGSQMQADQFALLLKINAAVED